MAAATCRTGAEAAEVLRSRFSSTASQRDQVASTAQASVSTPGTLSARNSKANMNPDTPSTSGCCRRTGRSRLHPKDGYFQHFIVRQEDGRARCGNNARALDSVHAADGAREALVHAAGGDDEIRFFEEDQQISIQVGEVLPV